MTCVCTPEDDEYQFCDAGKFCYTDRTCHEEPEPIFELMAKNSTCARATQKLAYDLIGNRKGSVVVIDLRDFSIPVAVSAPSISANTLRDITSSQYQDLLNDSNRPLFNRAFMGLYPPASTIKPLLSTFALSNQYTSW